jgi:hypothetical protein
MATTGPQQAHSTLIVVCCHAIYIGTADHDPDAGKDEHKDWLIEPFQKGETPTFIDHIKKGVQTLRACVDDGKDALLIYSGGPTKQSKGCQIAEGESYLVGRRSYQSCENAGRPSSPWRSALLIDSERCSSTQSVRP